ncbi:MAG TPA: glycosyltransferase [Ktedonobacterales bacterium]|nr:glycosyltransferase [Ktedonobacterales bacterium]
MEHAVRQPVHYLFVLWDGGGNVPPQLALARRLTERGHHVRILAPHILRSRIEVAGCQFVPLHETPEHDSSSRTKDVLRDWEARTSMGAASLVRDRLIFGRASGYASDVTAAIADERPNVVVTDYLLLGGYIAAERAGIPLAALIHTVYPLPAPGMPPYGMGFQPAKGMPGRVRDALFAPVFRRFYNARLNNLNAVRAAMGLRPLTSAFEQFARANRLLVLTSQAFDFPADSLPANVRYVGPQLDDPAWLAPWEPAPTGDTNLPLVLVSLSTTYQQQGDVVRRVVAALADLPVRGLVTLGPALDGNRFSLPPNVRAEPYAPHVLICPHADLVITHGGHGTVITALNAGVPLVCLPMGRDQADNAARVVWRGVGVRCSSKADAKTLRAAIQQVLGEARFREGARRIANGIARDGGPAQAIAELENLASPVALVSE